METKEFERLEKWFWRGKMMFYIGIGVSIELIFLTVLYWHDLWPLLSHMHRLDPFFKTHPVIAWMMVLFSNAGTFLVYAGFRALDVLYDEFIKRSAIQDAATTLANVTSHGLRRPKFSFFVLSKNLKEFERKALRFYEDLRKKAVKIKHVEQLIRDAEATDQKVKELGQQFSAVLASVTTEAELQRYRSRFNAAQSFAEARSIIRELETKSEKNGTNATSQVAKRDRLRGMLTEISADGMCLEATSLLDESERVPYVKQAVDLLKLAITAQKQANKGRGALQLSKDSTSSHDDAHSEDTSQRALSELFPAGIDREMATQILVAIARENPEQHGKLRIRTAGIYRAALKKSFPARSFDETIIWLREQRIVLAKMEKNDPLYSLNSKPSSCFSKCATDIVRKIMAFENAMTKSNRE